MNCRNYSKSAGKQSRMIRILDSFVSDKIAAGEVIERPVSAVKELIENSIDAGVSSVIVEIRGGGRDYIRITDDGCGIHSDEIETAFLRHATSKISKVTDLDNITSLGFRGEALASIAAVSRLTIISKPEDEASGTKMVLHAGRVVSKEKVGANKGTTIVCEDLFYNTPARRKFLKTDAREASLITELVQHYAIYYSDIRFMMINNGNTLFTTPGNSDTAALIRQLYPDKAHESLIPLEGEGISGYISDPGTVISSKKGQLFFVNGRVVSSKIIEKALTDGYGGRIFSGFPVAILFIDADPSDLDVNIHPGKREILFLHADDVSSRISSSVAKAVDSEKAVPHAKPSIRVAAAQETKTSSYESPVRFETEYAHEESVTEQSSIKDYLGSLEREAAEYESNISQQAEQIIQKEAHAQGFDFETLIFKGYIFNTYIITESGDTLYVFDQHAAHERILYEKLTSAYHAGDKLRQPLLTPLTINVSADVYNMKSLILEVLVSMGYVIEDFGGSSFIIREIPSYMSSDEAFSFVSSFCSSDDLNGQVNDTVIDKLIMKSCKSAVKGGDKLSETEIMNLIKELSTCGNPYSCPHGRPTFVKLTKYDVERTFKRK